MTEKPAGVLASISRLSTLTLMAGLLGCAGNRRHPGADQRIDDPHATEPGYNRITDQGIADSRTEESVREALAAGVDYKYDGVKVVAGNGVVQLSGHVNTGAQKIAAGEITWKVPGVKNVLNNLTIKSRAN